MSSINACKEYLYQHRKPTSLKEVYDFLKGFKLSDGLYEIGLLQSGLSTVKIHKGKEIPEKVTKWIQTHIKNEDSKIWCIFTLSRMARYLILSGSNDHKNKILSLENESFLDAYNKVVGLWEGKVESEQDLKREFARLAQQQHFLYSTDLAILGRGYLLFLKIPNEISFDYDFDSKLREYFGFGIFEFLATSLFEWFNCVGKSKERKIEVKKLASLATPENQKKYRNLFSGSVEDYKKKIRGEADWKTPNVEKDINGIEPFFRVPLIKTKNSNDLIVVHPYHLLYQVAMGIFYLLDEKERSLSRSVNQNDFRNKFGELYQCYAAKLLSRVRSPAHFVDMDREFGKEKGFPDFAIIRDEICCLFEIKTTLLGLETRANFDLNKLEEEVTRDKGAFDKAVKQFSRFDNEIENIKVQNPSFSKVKKIIRIIVGFDDIFHANELITPIIRNHYGSNYGEGSVKNLHIITINGLEMFAGVLENEEDFIKTFSEKFDDEGNEKEMSTDLYESFSGLKLKVSSVLDENGNEFFNEILR